MKRRLKVLALCAAALLAARMMGQDTGGGGGGAAGGDATGTTAPDTSGGMTSPDTSGGAGSTGAGTTGGENTNGGTTNPGTGTDNGTGAGTTGAGGTESTTTPGTTQPGTTPGSTIVPSPSNTLPPGFGAPVPGTTPLPANINPNTTGGAGQGGTQPAPVTFTLPGGYGGANSSQIFTLGQGRLAKPPITFSLTVSQGYDDNLYNADAHPTPTPKPQPTPGLVPVTQYFFGIPFVVGYVRPKVSPTPKPVAALGRIGSPVTTMTLSTQVQAGTARTVVTGGASIGANDYYSRPGKKIDYTGAVDLEFVHKLTPRATVSLDMNAVYQKTPNFSLLNAPTSAGTGGDYLNGSLKVDLTYTWTSRLSTVTSYALGLNLLQTNASQNQYDHTFGTQFRYTVSARNTVTAELRESIGIYPSNASADNYSTSYLLGLDSFISSRLRNTFSGGIQVYSVSSSGGNQSLPTVEDDITLGMPRGASLTWTNSYGFQGSGNASQTTTSYRTGLTYSQPLSTKLIASLSISYNNLQTTDSAVAANSNTQNQLQAVASLGYTVSPRLSVNLSYTYLLLLNTIPYNSYYRDQVYMGGTYQFR